jgi:hypothetical protein
MTGMRPRHRWEDKINRYLTEINEDVGWIHVAQHLD